MLMSSSAETPGVTWDLVPNVKYIYLLYSTPIPQSDNCTIIIIIIIDSFSHRDL